MRVSIAEVAKARLRLSIIIIAKMRRQPLIMVMLLLSFFSNAWGRSSMLSEDDIKRELKMLNKPYAISFKDNYGVVFDCVDIYKQPAFDHPLLKDHKLQFAQVLFDSQKGSPFQGVSAVVDVCTLAVPPDAASLAQIIVVDDRPTKATVVQSGWHIDPDFEGDGQTRFMVFWTADDYHATGCGNMLCPGFVVMNQAIAPGMALPTGTTATIAIERDSSSGNWQVFLNQEMVGYFPAAIVNGMDGGTQVQMGGSVYSPPQGSKSPAMGTGVPPLPGPYDGAAKFTWVSLSNSFTCRVTKDVANPSIYNVMVTSTSPDGPQGVAFLYGGPGDI